MITTPSLTYHSPYSIDPNSASTNTETPAAPTVSRTKRGVASTKHLWPQHKVLTIAFMDTPAPVRAFIQQQISAYSPHINIQLKFVEGAKGDIRISTHKDIAGDWSYKGTAALKVPEHKPTLHLNTRVHSSFLAMNALHEFGHALGLLHEHQHPDRTLDFNSLKTYKLYEERLGIDKTTVYENVLKKHQRTDVITSDYDPKSIMHYNLHESVLWEQPSTGYNAELSEADKAFLTSLYPPSSSSPNASNSPT